MTRAFISVWMSAPCLNVLNFVPAPRPSSARERRCRPPAQALRIDLKLPIVCLEALTCSFHAVHVIHVCGAPLSALREFLDDDDLCGQPALQRHRTRREGPVRASR